MRTIKSQRHDPNLWPPLLAGLAGGLAGTWVMTQFQTAWSRLTSDPSAPQGRSSDRPERNQPQQEKAEQEQEQAQEPATTKAASAIASRLFHHELTPAQKKLAGPAVHYGFGTAMGGLYGALAATAPAVTRAAGLPFGAALWAAADEAAVPALGFSKPPTQYPASTHVYGLTSHLVYGLATEMVRRALSRAWQRR